MSDYYYAKIEAGLIDQPEDTPEILDEQRQIWDYMPLVRKLANYYASHCNLGYRDLCQQGYLILAETAHKIDWLSNRNKITKYVNTTLSGKIKRYIAKFNTVIGIPNLDSEAFEKSAEIVPFEEWSIPEDDDILNPEQELLKKEKHDRLVQAVQQVATQLNDREYFVLYSCLMGSQSYKQLAEEFDVHKSSIGRDAKRIITKMKEALDEYPEA
jgi:RNA polymerase sigma factor (sigma-70 family)